MMYLNKTSYLVCRTKNRIKNGKFISEVYRENGPGKVSLMNAIGESTAVGLRILHARTFAEGERLYELRRGF